MFTATKTSRFAQNQLIMFHHFDLWRAWFFKNLIVYLIPLGIFFFMINDASAHKASDSYLRATINQQQINLQWDIAIRDLEVAVGVDDDGNGEITWGELQGNQTELIAYALPRLAVTCNGQQISFANNITLLVDKHSDGPYAVLNFAAPCPKAVETLGFRYQLLFDIDAQHRGIVNVSDATRQYSAILSPAEPMINFDLQTRTSNSFRHFVIEGIYHIFTGYDHVLFLLTLLIAAVFQYRNNTRQTVTDFYPTLVEVTKIVTSFTLAHSLTLTLAALGIVTFPAKFIEIAIALSVIVVAILNLYPIAGYKRWSLALVFGFIHGFGFANILGDAGLQGQELAFGLIGFNLGVEIGQLAIVGVFVPIAYYLRNTWFYQQLIFKGGSMAVILIAIFWAVERSLII